VTQTLATFSNSAIVAATVVYALAMLAHAAEWALARQLPTSATAAERVLVTAGSDASVASPSGATNAPDEPGMERSDRFGRTGLALTVLGAMIAAVGVVCRGLAASRVPWGSMYEFAITGSLAVVVAYLFLVRRYSVRWLGLFVTGFLVTVLGVAVLVLYRPVAPLTAALHSYWLAIHVSAAAVAGGAYTVGALLSVLYLLRSRLEARAAVQPGAPRTGFLWRTPPATSIDRIAYRVHAFAFPLWTFAVLAGAIWAQYAWGRFWGWDPKEVWAFITWVAYAAYLHARATAGWQGRAAAYVALLGYATFLFNFVGINLFGSGLHAYSGM
jgi:cytochrome c-type biogenesis protein CcsB